MSDCRQLVEERPQSILGQGWEVSRMLRDIEIFLI